MISFFKKSRHDLEWSRRKALTVFGPNEFGHHYVFVDHDANVAVFLPKSDKTLHIMTGNAVSSQEWEKYDLSGNRIANRSVGAACQWKITPDAIYYRGPILPRQGPPHRAEIRNVDRFDERISPFFVRSTAQTLVRLMQETTELPTSAIAALTPSSSSQTAHEIVETLFEKPEELVKFFASLQQAALASSDGNSMAILKKESESKWSYTVMLMDGRHVGSHLRPFKPSIENFELFNAGCREMARRLRIYIATGDLEKVPQNPPAFGALTLGADQPLSKYGYVDLEPDKGPPEYAIPGPDGRQILGGGGRALPLRNITCQHCYHEHTIEPDVTQFRCKGCGEIVRPPITLF